MSKGLTHLQSNLQGANYSKASYGSAPSCSSSWTPISIDGHAHLIETDNCGKPTGAAFKLGTCSVDENGDLYAFDENGNQIITLPKGEHVEIIDGGDGFWYATDPQTGVTAKICKNPVKSVGGVLPDENGDVPHPIATFVLNADGSATYTDENGLVTTVPAPTVSSLVQAGSVITHTNGNGVAVSFDICAIVAANCNSPMTILADGSISYTDNAGVTTVIPAPVPETVTTMTVAGTIVTYTSENGTVSAFDFCDCADVLTSLVPDNANATLTYTDENGVATVIDMCALVASCHPDESVTTLSLNAAGDEFTYTSENGTVTTVPFCAVCPVETVTTLVLQPDGSIVYTSENGTATTIPAATVSSLAVAGAVVTHTSGNGTVTSFDICAIVAANCNSPMVANADGSLTYTDNAGTVTTIPAATNSALTVDIAAGTFTHVSGSGANTVVDVCALAQLCAPTLVAGPAPNQYTFNNGYGVTTVIDVNELDMDINSMTVTGSVVNFSSEDGTTGSFDICAIVAANCNSPMILNADGSVSYTDNANVTTVIPAPVVTTLVLNADGSATYTSENGTVTTIPAPTVSQIVEAGGVVTHTNGAGTAVSFDICAIVAANCNSPMVVNADGSVTYTDNAGAVTTIPAPAPSIVTTLAANADGSFTYTSEDGTVTTIPAPVVTTFTDKLGAPITGGALLLSTDFTAGAVADGDVVLAQDSAGNCKLVPAPVDDLVIECPEGSNEGSITIGDADPIPFIKELNKCTDAGPAPIDVNADVIAIEGRVRADRSTPLDRACFDPACFPAVEACDQEGDRVSKDGVTFELINDVWEAVDVSPRETVQVMNDDPGGTTSMTDADIAAVGGATPVEINCIEESYTNNDCVRVRIEADVRTMAQASSEVAGNLWTMQMQQAAGTVGFALNMGAPNSLLDTEGVTFSPLIAAGDPWKEQQKDLLWSKWFADVDPGETVTLRVCFKVGTPQYESHAANSIDSVVMAGRFQIRRAC